MHCRCLSRRDLSDWTMPLDGLTIGNGAMLKPVRATPKQEIANSNRSTSTSLNYPDATPDKNQSAP
jgi:hypothetical protein